MTKQPFTTLFNLVPGETYQFRVGEAARNMPQVRADNIFGTSDPSEASEEVFVRDVTRAVVEPLPKEKKSIEPEAPAVDYEKVPKGIEVNEYKTVDLHRLPNDLQAKVPISSSFEFFQYIICEELGRGAYGTVYRAVERATGKNWAAKMVQVLGKGLPLFRFDRA